MKIKYQNKYGKRIILKCDFCGEVYETLEIKAKNKNNHFCSAECYLNFKKQNAKYKTIEDIKLRNKLYQKKNKYGITEEEYNKLFEEQNNKCAICDTPFEEIKGFVDHDHLTKKVRGILCTRCNTLLGMARDNVNILQNAISYLQKN